MTKSQFNLLTIDERLGILDSFVNCRRTWKDFNNGISVCSPAYDDIQLECVEGTEGSVFIRWDDPDKRRESYSPRTFKVVRDEGSKDNGYKFKEV